MRGAAFLILCLILLAPGVPAAQETTETRGLQVAVSVPCRFGDTKCEMNARVKDPAEPGTLADIRSRLDAGSGTAVQISTMLASLADSSSGSCSAPPAQ